MPHLLCFADLHLGQQVEKDSPPNLDSDGNENIGHCTSNNGKSASVDNILSVTGSSVVPFELEPNKKSSYTLSCPIVLRPPSATSHDNINDDHSANPSKNRAVSLAPCQNIGNNDQSDASAEKRADTNNADEPDDTAAASIIFCTHPSKEVESKKENKLTKMQQATRQVFLFGGFELIANVKSVKVHVTRPTKGEDPNLAGEEEVYLTTCKGIPARNISFTTSKDQQQQQQNHQGEGGVRKEQNIAWYKFVLAQPGGPKPIKCVRLQFIKLRITEAKTTSTTCHEEKDGMVTIHSLKVKCRLQLDAAVTKSTTSIPQQAQMYTPFFGPSPVMASNNIFKNQQKSELSGSIPSSFFNDSRLVSMMASLQQIDVSAPMDVRTGKGEGDATITDSGSADKIESANNSNNAQGLPGGQMQFRKASKADQITQIVQHELQMQQKQFQNHQQKQLNQTQYEQQQRQQAEIISSVAGLGMYLKSSEERSMHAFQTALSSMEDRIMKRLDILSRRMEVIEGYISKNDSMNGRNNLERKTDDESDDIEIENGEDINC